MKEILLGRLKPKGNWPLNNYDPLGLKEKKLRTLHRAVEQSASTMKVIAKRRSSWARRAQSSNICIMRRPDDCAVSFIR